MLADTFRQKEVEKLRIVIDQLETKHNVGDYQHTKRTRDKDLNFSTSGFNPILSGVNLLKTIFSSNIRQAKYVTVNHLSLNPIYSLIKHLVHKHIHEEQTITDI